MAEKSDKIFNFLVGAQELSDNQRKQYTSVALNNLRKETSNGERMDELVRKYLLKCDSDLKCMQDPGLSKEQAELIANYYAYAGISLQNVRPLCANMELRRRLLTQAHCHSRFRPGAGLRLTGHHLWRPRSNQCAG